MTTYGLSRRQTVGLVVLALVADGTARCWGMRFQQDYLKSLFDNSEYDPPLTAQTCN